MRHDKAPNRFLNAPIWLVGFRPFFIATCISGALLPILWVVVYSGAIEAPDFLFRPFISPLHWHVHEMFFGFGWALLGGFLLTASKNWLGIRGRHGLTLVILVTLWILDRIAMAYGGNWPKPVVYLLSFPFIVTIISLLEFDLLRNHKKDSYKDNIYFILALPLFIGAKFALLNDEGYPALGISMTLALFRLCFLIMLERTLEAFMKGAIGIKLKRIPWVDHSIKTLGFVLIFSYGIGEDYQAYICLLLATLMLIRWCYWHPLKALQRIDIGIMYLGYLAIVANLIAQGFIPLDGHWGSSVAIHLFTLGSLGLIAPAMIVRISNGHTGRKVSFTPIDKLCIYLMLGALACRVGLPFLIPNFYTQCLYLSATFWFMAFTILGFHYTPLLLHPRIDGRTH